MKLRIVICVTALFAMMSFKTMPPKEWFMMKTTEYSIQYPPNWKTDKTGLLGTKFILFSPKDSTGNRSFISLSSQPEASDSVSVDSLINSNKINLPNSIENYAFISEEKITVNGRICFRISYSGTQSGRNLRWIQQGCVVKSNYYVLTFTATEKNFSKLYQVATEIMNTIQYY